MRRQILVLAAVLAFLWAACIQAAIVYEVIDLGTLGGDRSKAHFINSAGQIVGWASTSQDFGHAALFGATGDGNIIDLGTLSGDRSIAQSINSVGQIVGWAHDNQVHHRATIFDSIGAGNNIDLGTLGGDESRALSINDAGQIVGEAINNHGSWRATLFDPTGASNNIDLGTLEGDGSWANSINDAGQIVGAEAHESEEADYHATIFDPTGAGNNIDLGTLGGDWSMAYSINDANQIVGAAQNSLGFWRATLFDPTGTANNIDLGTLGGNESYAYSINDAGQIVGGASSRAILYDPTGAGKNIDLNTLIDPNCGWILMQALCISETGWIAGEGWNQEGELHAFLLVPQSSKYSGGTGEPNDPYQIATAEDLMLLGETPEDYDKHFILTADIDLDPNLPGRKVFDRAVIAPDVNDTDFYYDFQGIPFSGVFNGNGHTISHLTIEGISNLGLFGQLHEQAVVSNVGLAEVNVNGVYGVGAIVGDNFGGSITDSSSNGSVNGNWFVGGLVGNNSVGSITGSCSTGVVTGKGDVGGLVGNNGYPERSNAVLANCYSTAIASGGHRVGGLVGSNDKGSITTCFSTGAVTGIGDVGGLVGNNSVGSITDSFSTGRVSGDDVVGGLVGYNADSNITMSYSSGDVSGGDWTAGGLVGWNYNGRITTSYSRGLVTGNWIVGGLVGLNDESSINTSYSSSTVTGYGDIGGLVGHNNDSNITMSYSSGVVTGNEDVGGLVGDNWLNLSGVGSTTFSFWDMESSGQTISAGGEGKTTSEMQTASTFLEAGWDFVDETVNGPNDIWKISEGLDYPRLWWEKYGGGNGTAEDPYQIATAEDLLLLGDNPEDYDKHFILTTDIDLDPNLPGRKVFDRAVIAPDTNDVEDWFQGTPFTGVFDGNGHTISNMTIAGDNDLGLFGQLDSGAMISNLGLEAVCVSGTGNYVGGLVGHNWQGSISACYSNAEITGYGFVGGLVGENFGNITTSYSTCEVRGERFVGGLTGWNSGSITTSYSNAKITGDGFVGGLVGRNAGGGDFGGPGIITTSYSTGMVTGGTKVGGLVGGFWSGSITASFWDIQTSGQTNMCGSQEEVASSCDDSFGLTTAEMQTENTFTDAGWDFVDETENGTEYIWWILEGQDYPRLSWKAHD